MTPARQRLLTDFEITVDTCAQEGKDHTVARVLLHVLLERYPLFAGVLDDTHVIIPRALERRRLKAIGDAVEVWKANPEANGAVLVYRAVTNFSETPEP